jgi:DNA-binding IclR family transcriptional regulator
MRVRSGDRGTSPARPERTVKLSPFARVRAPGLGVTPAKSAGRALELVEHLALAPEPLRAIELARALSLSPSSVHQILRTLMDGGYLIFDAASKRYHLSPRTARFAARASAGGFRPEALEALMGALAEMFAATVTLAAPQGGAMQVIAVRHPQERPAGEVDEGFGVLVPFFGTCTGAAWLAAQNDDVVRGLMRRSRRDLGRRSHDPAGVLQSVRRVRQQGYAFGGLLADDGMWSVATALPPDPHGLVLVLAVSAPDAAIEERAADIACRMRAQICVHLGTAENSEERITP